MKPRLPAHIGISLAIFLVVLWVIAYLSFPKIEWLWVCFGFLTGGIFTVLAWAYLDDSPTDTK